MLNASYCNSKYQKMILNPGFSLHDTNEGRRGNRSHDAWMTPSPAPGPTGVDWMTHTTLTENDIRKPTHSEEFADRLKGLTRQT